MIEALSICVETTGGSTGSKAHSLAISRVLVVGRRVRILVRNLSKTSNTYVQRTVSFRQKSAYVRVLIAEAVRT